MSRPHGAAGWRPAPGNRSSVVCPVCRERVPWDDNPVQVVEWLAAEGRYRPLDLTRMSPGKQSLRRSECYVVCPGSTASGDPLDQHHLPADYRRYGDPLVVGLVGRPFAGKTHLAVAMLAELFRGAGSVYGLTGVQAMDQRRHARFETQMLNPFLAGERLAGTASGEQFYAESIRVSTPTGKRTIAFFDIGGDEFSRRMSSSRDAEFLLIVDGLLFVEAVDEVRTAGNEWITGAQGVLEHVPQHDRLPAAIVLSKADQERYSEPLDRWLREPPFERPLSRHFHEESRDVYAWLRRSEAAYLMELVESFPRATLHVASASGGAADSGDRFPRGVRPTRVLEPLVSLLVGLGVLPDEARPVTA